MTKHPSEASLALFAGGELGRWRTWSVERHVAVCAECRRDISDFSTLRAEASQMAELPGISWNRLAAEMKANIRLGLEAGECVTRRPVARVIFSARALAACFSLAALLVASVFLERPAPRGTEIKSSGPVLESSIAGIQVSEGGQTIMLLNNARKRDERDVDYLATGGTMRARYVDADTGNVTINNVYVQ